MSPLIRRSVLALAIAFVALIGATLVGFQDNLFRYWHNPREPFQSSRPPPQPDYSNRAAWAARPKPAQALRSGSAQSQTPRAPAVFFIHPTTYWGGGAWNAAIDHPAALQRLQGEALPTYAGPFAAVGDLWAPHYRQASLYTFLTHHYDARRARALAYEDVSRAFEAFLAAIPAGQPIIIAGVEQGGLHALGLLQHTARMDQVRRRLIAAYIMNQATPLDLFEGPIAPLTPCATPDAVGCVVAWGAAPADDSREIRRLRRRSMAWAADGRLQATADRALLCVNPITWDTSEDYAPPRTHRGAVNASGFSLDAIAQGGAPPAAPGQTSAHCQDGVLLVDKARSPSLRDPWRWGGRFKPSQTNLFYADLREGVQQRVTAYITHRDQNAGTTGAARPPDDEDA